MYSSYLTRETFENEHDEKMTRKFSYNYQVLKRLFPEVYKLPESEIRSLVHSIYDNPKLGDELLDHLSDVINKKKPEWGEYLNPKPEEPEPQIPDFQSAQQLNNVRLQNYYNRPFTSYIPWGEVGQAAKDGMASGLEQVLNGATLGAYNYLDRHSDNAAAERYNRLQNDAYQAGIGNWYDRVQMANKAAGKYITRNLLKKHLF